MAHPYVNDPVVSELDEIAQELEKTGNADLAVLVDEVSAELMTSQRRTVAAKKAPKKEEKPEPKAKAKGKKGKKPAKKEAETNFSSRRARIASAMRKIARAQVAELEDIAAELLKEGEKKAALEVLKIAEDLDSDYDYSTDGKHSSPESKGDASKRYDREKANKPDAKMDAEEKESLELPFGEKGEGYPKQSAFDKQLDSLIRLAMEEDEPAAEEFSLEGEESEEADEEMDLGEDAEEGAEDEESEESEESEDSDEDSGDMDLGGLDEDEEMSDEGGEDADDMDLGGLDLGDGEDELASMMEAMDAEPTDMEASDRMYEAEEGEEGSEEEEPGMPPAAGGEEEDMDMEMDMAEEGSEEELSMDDDSDTEAMDLLPNLEVSGPMGTGFKFSSSDKTKMAALAKKLAAKGEKGLAARVAKLAKK